MGLYSVRKTLYFLACAAITLSFTSAQADSLPLPVSLSQGQAGDAGQAILDFISNGGSESILSTSLLSTISHTLNFIALFMMAVLTAFGSINFVIQTANKGTPGGQVISSFWAPLRLSIATILLIPLPGGYSSIQIAVHKVASEGNSAANQVMSAGLNYIYTNGIYRPPVIQDSSALLLGWVASEVCAQYLNNSTGEETITPQFRTTYSSTTVTSTFTYDRVEPESSTLHAVPRTEYCGGLSIDIPRGEMSKWTLNDSVGSDQVTPDMMQPRFEALIREFQPSVALIAADITSDLAALRELQSSGNSAQDAYESANAAIPKKIQKASVEFVNLVAEMNSKIATVIASSVSEQQDKLTFSRHPETGGESWKDEMIRVGWPALGTLFFKVNKGQEQINEFARVMQLSVIEPKTDEEYRDDQNFNLMGLRVVELRKAVPQQRKSFDLNNGILYSIEDSGANGKYDIIKSVASGGAQTIVKSFVLGGADSNLISSLQYSGSVISTTGEIAIVAAATGVAAAGAAKDSVTFASDKLTNAAGKIPFIGSITGSAAAVAGSAVVATVSFAESLIRQGGDLLSRMLPGLLIGGFVLAVVLPAIPLILWTFGVISWSLFYVECLLVSPMWLAAHGTAEKEGWGTESTRQGYMLMIGLFISPIMRVAGFFACFLVLRPIGLLVQFFAEYLQGVVISGILSMTILILAPLLLAIVSYGFIVRVFSLPNELFERALRWVNGGQEVTGDEKAEGQTRGYINTGTSKAENAASSFGREGGKPTSKKQGSVSSPG